MGCHYYRRSNGGRREEFILEGFPRVDYLSSRWTGEGRTAWDTGIQWHAYRVMLGEREKS